MQRVEISEGRTDSCVSGGGLGRGYESEYLSGRVLLSLFLLLLSLLLSLLGVGCLVCGIDDKCRLAMNRASARRLWTT